MTNENIDNPYVGPRTFTEAEHDLFFGRDREASDLCARVLSERLVLFYAQSGAGKSSLINTRLIPKLREEYDYTVLPVARVSGELPSGVTGVDNIYLFNLMLSLDSSGRDSGRFANMQLSQFLAGLSSDDGRQFVYQEGVEPVQKAEAQSDSAIPYVLIIDQFEEILTDHPHRWKDREVFFRQMDQAMAKDPLLWVVLTLREDYVAELEPYAPFLASRMRARFYMQRMDYNAALEAVKKPAELAGWHFAEGVAEELVKNLCQIRVFGQKGSQVGQYVAPVQLQVVCFQLWEKLRGKPDDEITVQDLKKAGNVDSALADFYELVVAKVLQEKDTGVSEIDLRNWFEKKLITEAGTRGTVYQGVKDTAGLPNQAVKALEMQFLLRTEIRAGGTWYELVHDCFVDPILQSNQRWWQDNALMRDTRVSQTAYNDLEIRILARQTQGYPVEITFNHEKEFQGRYLDSESLPLPCVDTAAEEADGERLFQWLLSDVRLKTAWHEVRGRCPRRRIRLRIDDSAPELHALPWELLRDPGYGSVPPQDLAAAVATPFSRYLAGQWQPGSPILKRPIKILVAIADPQNLETDYDLSTINVDHELFLLMEAVRGLDVEITLFSPPPPGFSITTRDGDIVSRTAQPKPCMLSGLEFELKKGYHVLHFIGHGGFSERDQKAVLYMADSENRVKLEDDTDIAEMLARQLTDTKIREDDKLRLVFLGNCQTATRSTAEAFRRIAPKLVAAGVPAVVAMQDLVPLKTGQAFASNFYAQLLQHGQVDLAANEARSSLLTARLPGAAIPVLFMRLLNGQLFRQRGQILDVRAERFWGTLLRNIADGNCTPVLGPEITSGLLPSPAEVAQQLAAEHNYPLTDVHSLPQVAQFVGTKDKRLPRQETIRRLVAGFKRRMGLKFDTAVSERNLSETIESSNWPGCTGEEFKSEIHQQLADLNLPLYVTTNFDNFMTLALKARGCECRRETVKWIERMGNHAHLPHYDLNPPPSPGKPVVLHLFGTDEDPLSMVLTEDDYLNYLACISRDYENLLPTSVQEKLASTTLLFLGYRMEDLDLKVILRGLFPNLDIKRWGNLHVFVRIESTVVDQSKLQEVTHYFQECFAKSNIDIDIYWGSAQQFVAELHARWQEYKHA